MEKVKKSEGLFIQRPDGTLIAGFYKGRDPKYSDNDSKVWCVKCKDEMPKSTVKNTINPIIYQYKDQYADKTIKENLDNIDNCYNCGGKIPAPTN